MPGQGERLGHAQGRSGPPGVYSINTHRIKIVGDRQETKTETKIFTHLEIHTFIRDLVQKANVKELIFYTRRLTVLFQRETALAPLWGNAGPRSGLVSFRT